MRFMVRPYDETSDAGWAHERLEAWGGRMQTRRGALIDATAGHGLVAEEDGRPVGMVFWRDDGDETELTLLWAFEPRQGVGTALVSEMLRRVTGPVWVVTTDDNVPAVAFYTRLGFAVREVRVGAVDEARRTLKPQLPATGPTGFPMHDEIELLLVR
jgi:ribosomal protein S18 acetylase RimI-like enzyme